MADDVEIVFAARDLPGSIVAVDLVDEWQKRDPISRAGRGATARQTPQGGAITCDGKLGYAEALRRAMLSLIDKGEPNEAHPACWASFIVVGEGAAR